MLTFIANLCVQIPPEDVNHASALHRCCRKIRACRWCRKGTWGRWWRRTSISRCPAWCLQSSGSKKMGRMISLGCSAVDRLRPSPTAAHYTVLPSRKMQRAITWAQCGIYHVHPLLKNAKFAYQDQTSLYFSLLYEKIKWTTRW